MILNTELEYKGNLFPTKIISYVKNRDTLTFTTENGVALQVTVVRDSVLRFRFTTTSVFEKDFSYAITKYSSRGYNFLDITEDDSFYIITTSKLICNISKADLRSFIYDEIGRASCREIL